MISARPEDDVPASRQIPDAPELKFTAASVAWLDRRGSLVFGALGLVLLLVAWQVCAVTGIVDVHISSDPSQVAAEEVTLFGNGTLWGPLGATAAEVGWALAIIIIGGIPTGIILGRVTPLRQMADPIVSILNSVPYVLFLPLIIFWFGLGETARVLVVVWAGILPLIINTTSGVRNISADYLRVGRVFSASPLRFFTSILLPAALPFILTGIRLAVARALVGAIVVEFFLSSNGLGYFVQSETSDFQMSAAMAGIVVMAVAALILTWLIGAAEKRVISWSQSS
ncbi:MAG TPA: ABC transporter permease [Trebonia sp.]|nr:ABC transporter permease [Trebonia sp.]